MGKVKSGNITFLKIPTAIILFETKHHNLDISSTQLTKANFAGNSLCFPLCRVTNLTERHIFIRGGFFSISPEFCISISCSCFVKSVMLDLFNRIQNIRDQ